MSKYNPQLHHRRSIRLKDFDYSKEGLYFITICCQNRINIFGEIIATEMKLNSFGKIAYEEWLKTEQIRPQCKLHEFIIMPNHIHGIIEITFNKAEKDAIGKFQSPSQTIGSFIRGFKIATIKRIKNYIHEGETTLSTGELKFAPTAPTAASQAIATEKIKSLDFKIWQRNYYEIIIRDEKAYHQISYYIINNPAKWKQDEFR